MKKEKAPFSKKFMKFLESNFKIVYMNHRFYQKQHQMFDGVYGTIYVEVFETELISALLNYVMCAKNNTKHEPSVFKHKYGKSMHKIINFPSLEKTVKMYLSTIPC